VIEEPEMTELRKSPDALVDEVRPQVLTLRLIIGAMAFGEVVFLIVALSMGPLASEAVALRMLEVMAAVSVAAPIVGGVVLRSLERRMVGGQESASAAAVKVFSFRVIGAALAEGTGMFMLVVILLGGDAALLLPWWLMTMVCLAFQWPSGRGIVEAWQSGKQPHRR